MKNKPSRSHSFIKYLVCCFMFVICSIELTACGFHLRGDVSLPTALHQIYIEDTAITFSKFRSLLIKALKDRHIIVVPRPSNNVFTLRILDEQYTSTIGSISSSTNTRQYLLQYNINYELRNPRGKVVLASEPIQTNRTLTINSNAMLGSSYEETTIKEEMRLDAVNQLINRLGSSEVATKIMN